MPSPILTMDIAVHLTGGFPPLVLDTRLAPQWSGSFDPLTFDPSIFDISWDHSRQLQLLTSLDSTLAEAAFSRVSRHQLVPSWRISVGGVDVPWHRLLPGLSVRESIDGTTQFSFSAPRRGVAHDSYTEPLGNPRSWLGVPGGKGAVEISAEFLTPSGRKSVPLVRDGLLDNTSGDTSPDQDVRTWNGGGAHARVDRVPITYQSPPGHGQTSGTVVRRLLTLAGVSPSKIAISGGRRLYKEISIIDGNAIQVANDILLPESRRVYHDDRSDTWQTIDYSGVSGKRVEAVITEDDVLAVLGSLGDSAASDSPTSIVLTSTGQVTRDECGRRATWQVIESFAIREIRGGRFTQDASGNLIPVTSPFWFGSPAELRLVRRQVSVVEYDCETVVARETAVWEWFAPEYARYHRNAAGTIDSYVSPGGLSLGGYIYDTGAAKDDSTPLYLWRSERFTVTSWQREEITYDDRNYDTTSVVKKGGWRFLELPIKTRGNLSATFESVSLHEGWVTADGRMVEHGSTSTSPISELWYGPSQFYDEILVSGDTFGSTAKALTRVSTPVIQSDASFVDGDYVEKITTDRSVNDDGFITQEVSALHRFFPRARRGLFLYDGTESDQNEQVMQIWETEIVSYAASGEESHDEFRSRYNFNGDLQESDEITGLPGYLPAAEQRTDIVPPASIYDDSAEAQFALAASRNESRPLKVEVSAPALTSVLVPWTMKGVTVQYAENEDDLAAVGIQMMRELSSIEVRVPLLFNPLIRPGHRLILSMPSIGRHFDFLVEISDHRQGESETWTQITGRQDVI